MVNKLESSNHERVIDRNILSRPSRVVLGAAVGPASTTAYRGSPGLRGHDFGLLLFEDRRSAKVAIIQTETYDQNGSISSGILKGFPRSLHAAWLAPVVKLKMHSGEYLRISITEIRGKLARFEVAPVESFVSPCSPP